MSHGRGAGGWESEATRRFASEHAWRQVQRSLGLARAGEALAAHRSRGEAARGFAEARDREEVALLGWLREPDAWPGVPTGQCQKPFHLWNVERAELDRPFQLQPVAPLRFGDLLAGEERPEVPWLRELSPRLMRAQRDRVAALFVGYELARMQVDALLRGPSPYGVRG